MIVKIVKIYLGLSLVAQEPQETQVQAPDWEDVLEEGMAIHPVSLLGESHGQRSLCCC